MAKRLLLNVLTKVLGEFIELDENNLSLAVWSGQVILSNLKLKETNFLKKYNFVINHGSVQTLEIIIPWASLLNSPLKIKLDGVYADISSLDEKHVDTEEILKEILQEKLRQLQLIDQYLELSQSMLGGEEKQTETYFQQWTSSIIDNIEVSLSHVHIRYEDSQTAANETFSVGITLESFVITTCDDSWQQAFVSRKGQNSSVNKLATIHNLGIYWEIDCESTSNLDFAEWKSYMHSMIQVRGSELPFKVNYLLAPNGSSMFMKLVHYKKPIEGATQFHVIAESNDLQLSLDKLQYHQIFQFYYRMTNRKKIVDPRSYRPMERPLTPFYARQWWKYAFRIIKQKPRYVKLIKMKKRAQMEEVDPSVLLSVEELQELQLMEQCYPLDVLRRFRQAVLMDILTESRKERNRELRKESVNWWSWLGSSKDNSNDISIETLMEEFSKQDNFDSKQSFSAFKISLSSSSNLTLSSRLSPIVELHTAVAVSIEKNGKAFVVSCNLTDLHIKDIMGAAPFHPQIVAVKKDHKAYNYSKDHSQSHKPTISITVTNTEEKCEISASALPIEIFINKIIIQTLLGEFAAPKNKFETRQIKPIKSFRETVTFIMDSKAAQKRATNIQKLVNEAKKKVEIKLEAHAPKIIIPEDCTKDAGYLLLDCGFLALNGYTSEQGMSFNVSLTSINAGLPLYIHDLYSLADLSLYLIKPFHFNLALQNIDKTIADTTADVSIERELRGCIDAVKLARLLRILTGLSDTFSAKPSAELNSASLNSSRSNIAAANYDFTPMKSQSENCGSEGFHTPIRMTLTPTKQLPVTPPSKSRDLEYTTPYNLNNPQKSDVSLAQESPGFNIFPPNPYKVGMKIRVNIPVMALDLSYSINNSPQQILFSIERLNLDISNRVYDRQIVLNMSVLSIQDSCRAPEQRYVVWTPQEGGDLVHILYSTMNNKLSPLYKEHGSEIRATFAQLGMAVDVITVSHLKPFFEVLLDKNNRSPPVPVAIPSNSALINMIDVTSTGQLSVSVEYVPVEDIPTGMKVYASLGKLSMDLLRCTTDNNENPIGEYLEPAFSMRIDTMLLNIDMKDLMKATVNLRSFVIEDSRSASKDYAFRNLFIPINMEGHNHVDKDAEVKDSAESYDGQEDLLVMTYAQESKSQSFIAVTLSGVTSFIAIDTILDFAFIFLANFFALTRLLSSPTPAAAQSTTPTPTILLPAIHTKEQVMLEEEVIGTSIPLELIISRSTMNITVKMTNSRLILLEDPALQESRALVGQCALEVHYTKDTKTSANAVELFESLHVTVLKNEVFVLQSIVNWNPLSILQPFDVELHFKRNRLNDETVSTTLQVELDDIEARVSFNDLLLTHTIFSRRFLADSSNNTATATTNTTSNVPNSSNLSSNSVFIVPTYNISFGLSSLSVVVINDFNAAAIPVIRLLVNETNFSADGPVGHIHGEGFTTMKIDYFNPPIMTWEPLLETWKPMFHVYNEAFSNILEIRSDHTLQLTVSGSMLVTLLRSYTLFFHEFENERADASAISLHNMLGDQIDIDILDSYSKQKFVEILDGSKCVLSAANTLVRVGSKDSPLPTAVDIVVKGPLANERLPILHLPFNTNKPKACILQPCPTADKKRLLVEPIEEEVFENCRYDPMAGKWRTPFLFGDPFEWTDASGMHRKDLSSIQIQSENWEWAGRWEVDMDGLVGVEMDKEGWEYAASFSNFSIVSPRRNFQSMDCVRRRRWTRTRIPRITVENHKNIPLTIFWDVKTLNNGSRQVQIRSAYQIINDLGCDLRISLYHSSWSEDYQVVVLKNGGTGNIPLLHSFGTQIKFQPALLEDENISYQWSNQYACNSNSYDCKLSRDVVCEAKDGRFIYFRMWTIRDNKSLTIKLVPYITIANHLLSHLYYRCSCLQQEMESQMIMSGENHKLKYINVVEEPQIAFQLGTYDWSKEYALHHTQHDKETMILMRKDHSSEEDEETLPICMKTKLSSDYTVEIFVYFKVAMIDRSGLNLLVRSLVNVQDDFELIRRFNSQEDRYLFFQKRHSDAISSPSPSTLSHSNSYSSNHLPAILSSSVATSDENAKSNKSTAQNHGQSTKTMGVSSSGKVDFKSLSQNLIDRVYYNTSHAINIVKADVGSFVYTDIKLRWVYMPYILRQKKMFKLPLQDKFSRTNNYLQFDVLEACIVLLFVDIAAQLKWISIEGYQKTSDIAIARNSNTNAHTNSNALKQKSQEYHYAIYGKLFPAGSTVVLRGNWDKNISCMYSVMMIAEKDFIELESQGSYQETQKLYYQRYSLYQQIIFQYNFSLELAGLCWMEGCESISASYTADQNITVRTTSEDAWSEEINIDTRKTSINKASFDISCPRSGIIYQLTYTLQNLPGIYHETQLVTFMPRYVILNCMDESIFVSQKGSNKHMEFFPYQPEGWHIIDDHFGTDIKLRIQSTIWSLGAININEIGSSVLYIPFSHTTSSTKSNSSTASTAVPFNEKEKDRGIVVHVEVKLAEKHDHCSIIVVIWQETIDTSAAMSIQNDSDVPITIRQADIELDHDLGDKENLYEFTVLPGRHVPYGWSDPDCGTNVVVGVGYSLKHLQKRVATLNMLKDGQKLRLPYTQSTSGNQVNEVVLTITTSDAGHVLYITKSNHAYHSLLDTDSSGASSPLNTPSSSQHPSSSQLNPAYNPAATMFGINLIFSSVGISLVLEKPKRREFMSVYMDGMELVVKVKGSMKTVEFTIMDLQLDNYSETAIYPVLLRSKKKEIHKSVLYNLEDEVISGESSSKKSSVRRSMKLSHHNTSTHSIIETVEDGENDATAAYYEVESEQEQPFIQLSIVQDQTISATSSTPRSIFRYVALRILSFKVEIDSASMQILFLDLLDDLKILTSSQILAVSYPRHWLQAFNEEQLFPSMKLINIYHSKLLAQQSKVYIKNLIIHPMKVTITFTQTTLPRKLSRETLQSTVLNIFMSLVGIEKLKIKLNSFEVEDAMESYETLVSLITTKSIQDVRSQLAMIAGSLAMIGSPVGFARKVGSGVRAFFYEPYLGAVHGSHDFFAGLKKGTSRLITGVVIGAMDSAVAFVGTASKGMSYLSGDIEYVRKRAIKRQQSSLIHGGGVYAGFRDGGESIISGFSSGMSGLLSKPFEEAAKGGIQGFFKGIGLGVLGAAVKPLVGLTEGLTSIAHGIANQVDPSGRSYHVRPPRALEPSVVDAHTLVIVALNLDAAFAQDFVMKRAHQHNYEDSFLSYIPLDIHQETVILSDVYLYWRRASVLWGRVWANISHCVYMGDAVGIMLYSGAVNGRAELATIRCGSRTAVKRLYTALTQNAHRMGNPGKVTPPDLIDWTNSEDWFQSNILSTSSSSATAVVQHHPSHQASLQDVFYRKLLSEAAMLGELDGYRFGSVNGKILPQVSGSEHDILTRAQYYLQQPIPNWKTLDEHIWKLLWEWGCIHAHLASCRCCIALFINHSDSPIQITRLHMLMGRNILIIGSEGTRYESESRLLLPRGYVIIFISAFPQSPLEIGHLKAHIHSAAFTAVLASTQRETSCEVKGGFHLGFLEKTVSEWWSKYVIVIS